MHLRDWLTQKGLTQEALGQRMSPPVSQGKVSHWLNGTRRVNLGEALQLHAITNGDVSFAELWGMYGGGRQHPTPMAAEVRDAA